MFKSHARYTHVKSQVFDKRKQKDNFSPGDQPKPRRKNLGQNKNRKCKMWSGREK